MLRALIASLVFSLPLVASADQITDAVQNDVRSNAQKARDEYRNPQQTLRFFEVEPTMSVVEIWPGGGWYANILAPLLKENGKYYAAHFHVTEDSPNYYKRSLESFTKRIKENEALSSTSITAFAPSSPERIAPDESVDRVLTFRNVHNWYMRGGDEGTTDSFKTFFRALKKGGILGVVEHRLPENRDDAEQKTTGYMKQSYVIAMAEKAGFKFVGSSDVNANSLDTVDHPNGVWTLPPRLRTNDEDPAKYRAIGESDRMTLKFVKPE